MTYKRIAEMTHMKDYTLKLSVNENILQLNRMIASRRLLMSGIKPISLAYLSIFSHPLWNDIKL